MRFEPTILPGAFLVDLEPLADERGFFARSFCAADFAARGLEPAVAQCNVSFNRLRGTLRGLHWQAEPHGEAKLVRVTAGAIWDVAVDLRRRSPAFRRHLAVALSAENRRAVYLPRGVAHGFLTLTDGAEVCYLMSAPYDGPSARGVRYDDPAFAIPWPFAPAVISPRDAAYPDFDSRSGGGG